MSNTEIRRLKIKRAKLLAKRRKEAIIRAEKRRIAKLKQDIRKLKYDSLIRMRREVKRAGLTGLKEGKVFLKQMNRAFKKTRF